MSAGLPVRAAACSTCIYRKNSPLDLARLEGQCRDAHGFMQGHRLCHHHDDDSGVVCRGFWNRHKDAFPLGQIAQRLGMVRMVGEDYMPQ